VNVDDFVAKLDGARKAHKGWTARCPAHHDTTASLTVAEGAKQAIVVHCFAGCRTEAIVAALGLSMSDLSNGHEWEAAYEYLREDGSSAYIVDRYRNPKTFRVRGHLPTPADRVLYQLPAIITARSAGLPVFYVEGEKDCHTLIERGHVATTNVSGAGGWLGHYAESLVDCDVTIIADNDQPGRQHARRVAAEVAGYASSVRVVVPRYGKDVTDLFLAGYGLSELDPLPEATELQDVIAANVRTRKVDWGWKPYFPVGKLSTVEGDPGDGKSMLTIDLAARWSSGAPMPDGTVHDGPMRVVLVSAEDDPEDVIVPRLIAAGARLDHVTLITGGATEDDPFQFATDLVALERYCVVNDVNVVIFDPLTAFMSSTVDSHNDLQVRHALYPLRAFATRTRTIVIVVRHLNKAGSNVKAIYRGNGSIAFTGAVRCSYVVAPDPDDPDGRVLACVKSNLARKPPALRYRIESTPDEVPYVTWGGPVDLTAQEALDGPRKWTDVDDERDVVRRVRAMEADFLRDVLAGGPLTWAEVKTLGKEDGFPEHNLRRARADIGLVQVFGEGGNRSVRWALPSTSEAHLPTCPPDVPPYTGPQLPWASGQMETESEVDSHPDECTVCGQGPVLRFYAPHWTVRCVDHDPRDFHG